MAQHKPVTVSSAAMVGVDAIPVTIEVMAGESEAPRILGLVDKGIREAYHRILAAFRSQGLPAPRGCPTMNFLPANLPKGGSGFDLPMALALAAAAGQYQTSMDLLATGEVSLQGDILPSPGVVAMAITARQRGQTRLLTSPQNAGLAALVPGIQVYAASNLRQALLWLRDELSLQPTKARQFQSPSHKLDLQDIRGHVTAKTALQVAAAGQHNLLLVGPPGSGKSALLRRLPGVLPPPSQSEALEILKVHTSVFTASAQTHLQRPFRSPHHTSSTASVLGGGSQPRPGEASLAQHGVLFLDELPEFRREVLEGLRQPLEDRRVHIGRAMRTVTMPADFMLVAAMNPCPCGYLGHPVRPCTCTPSGRMRYGRKISGPLLDRIDLQVEVPALPAAELNQGPDPHWSSSNTQERILQAVDRQQRRQGQPNGRLDGQDLELAVRPDARLLRQLEQIIQTYQLSGRARVRLLRIARSLADLDGRDRVGTEDLLKAARLRWFDQASGMT